MVSKTATAVLSTTPVAMDSTTSTDMDLPAQPAARARAAEGNEVLAQRQGDGPCRAMPMRAIGPSDLLCDMLRSARLRCTVVETLHFTAPWGFRVGAPSAAFYYVLDGRCRLEITNLDAVSLAAGDLVAVMPGHEHCLRDSRNSPSVSFEDALKGNAAGMRRGGAVAGEGRSTRLVYCNLVFDERQAVPLLASLPPVVVVQGVNDEAVPWLEQTLRLMIHESGERQPGSQSVVDHLAQVVFIRAVRACVTMPCDSGGTWLAALLDPEIGPALNVMHASLDSPWTVAELARCACLSRSVFASRFKALLSHSPMQYLMERRMQKACELLAEDCYGIKQIAARVGYTSKAAFSNAFKRWSGQSPQLYRRRRP